MTEEPQGENDLDAAKTRKVVEITARGFFDQMLSYGFTRNDIVHFTTDILDLVMDAAPASPPRRHAPTTYPVRYETSADGKVIGIEGPNLRLRPLCEEDSALLAAWSSDGSHRGTLIERILDMEAEEILHHFADERHVMFVVHLRSDGHPLGFVTYQRKWSDPSRAEMQKFLAGEKSRGLGYGIQMTYLWLHYGFDRLDLRKISAKTVDSNLANINLNRRLGFQFEGHLSKEVRLRDSYVDLTVMGVLKDKFLELGASERDASPSE